MTRSRIVAGTFVLACVLVDFFPRHGAPEFRYTGSDAARAVWNLGWPLAVWVYDPRNGFHAGPLAFPVVTFQCLLLAAGAVAGLAIKRRGSGSFAMSKSRSSLTTLCAVAALTCGAAARGDDVRSLRAAYSKPPAEWPAATLDEGAPRRELGPLPAVAHPRDNPYSAEKAALGRRLFFDTRLSGTGTMACATCHNPDRGWSDGLPRSLGHGAKAVRRNAPSLLNVGYATSLFRDGKWHSLEDQAPRPLLSSDEMRADLHAVLDYVRGDDDYRARFKDVFKTEADGITLAMLAQSIACFERTLVGGDSAFDRFLAGKRDALSDPAVRGLHVFRTTGRCMNCHDGPNFTDERFHNTGAGGSADSGRYGVTMRKEDLGAFRTPALRNVARTGPYTHDGSIDDLDGVLDIYNAGTSTPEGDDDRADDPRLSKPSRLLRPMRLSGGELADLKAFLESLTEEND